MGPNGRCHKGGPDWAIRRRPDGVRMGPNGGGYTERGGVRGPDRGGDWMQRSGGWVDGGPDGRGGYTH
jgi:hypothetical protein